MMLGNSGATIEIDRDEYGESVVKRGGDTDLRKQAEICEYLGPSVCPKVSCVTDTSYRMEYLCHIPIGMHPAGTFMSMIHLLRECVWNRKPLSDPNDGRWLDQLRDWNAEFAPWITRDLLAALYSGGTVPEMIHGDPTLANAMCREDGSLILIDPLPARHATPSLREVDVGKILQSVSGWEGIKVGREASRVNIDPQDIVDACSCDDDIYLSGMHWNGRCYLWAAIHCARVVRHGNPTTQMRYWSEIESRRWTEECRRVISV